MSEAHLHPDHIEEELSQPARHPRRYPETVHRHNRNTSHAVHHLIGTEMNNVHGYAEAKNSLGTPEDGSRYHRMHPKSRYAPRQSNQSEEPFQARETTSLEQPSLTDERLIKNALSVGLFNGSTAVIGSALAGIVPSLAAGATGVAGLLAAAPLAGGTIGYFAGKEFKHPVLGAATGAALTSAGMVAGMNTAAGLGAALSMWPAALTGATTYGLGEIHNYLWKQEGKERPGIVGTFLRGITSPVTIPVGLVRKALVSHR